MYIVFLKDEKYLILVKRTIEALGGQILQQLPQMRILLARLRVNTADKLKTVEGVKHAGPVTLISRVRRLQVRTDKNGDPQWHYRVDARNRIVRINNS